jgi:hypothetical protein
MTPSPRLVWQHPELMNRTVSFDIGAGGHPNVTYQVHAQTHSI